MPKDYEKLKKEDWDKYDDFLYSNPLVYDFEANFAVWHKEDKVLFLSMNKEDKELPYEINIGGLTFNTYKNIVDGYNALVKSF